MKTIPYNTGLALLTDLYQLTMAYGYWKSGQNKCDATFYLSFRKNPFKGGYAVACGLETVLEFLEDFHFTTDDMDYLKLLRGNDGRALFEHEFLDYLRNLPLSIKVSAVPEGTIVFPQEPLLRVQGPIILCQLLETALLNIINFQTLIATKASRMCFAAQGNPVIEFGLRRAQGIDGGLSASRAAYIGGCEATSNVLAGKLFGIPVRGTHAHSWVESFDSEIEAFEAYAKAMPNNCVFLVDTYDTIKGVHNAVTVGKQLREHGHEMVGIRLDSGDLAKLSCEARKILNDGGFPDARILASNDLDEWEIEKLKSNNAEIDIPCVGTRLVTGGDQGSLGGVYKLSAIRKPGDNWRDCIKISDDSAKTTLPGVLQIRRYYNEFGLATGDIIYDENDKREMSTDGQDLLVPVFDNGKVVHSCPSLLSIRMSVIDNLIRFEQYRGLMSSLTYPVLYDINLRCRRNRLIENRKGVRMAKILV